MKVPAIIPKPAAIGREALLVIAGAVVAAFVVGQLPELRDWMRRQWAGSDGGQAPH